MEYLMLLLSGTGMLLSIRYKEMQEKFFEIKIFGYWLLSIITITIQNSFPLPLGLAASLILFLNTNINRRAKKYSILSGLVGYVMSIIIYLLMN